LSEDPIKKDITLVLLKKINHGGWILGQLWRETDYFFRSMLRICSMLRLNMIGINNRGLWNREGVG
jgi:hypothetical protein